MAAQPPDSSLAKLICQVSDGKRCVSSQELMDYYKKMAKGYDQHEYDGTYGLVPDYLVEELANCISDKNAMVLDIACGTGILGKKLRDKGYLNVDGLDPSTDMTDIAKATNAYRRIVNAFLETSQPTPGLENNYYDAVVICGAFSYNHLDASCLPEILRMMKHGASLVSHFNAQYFGTEAQRRFWDTINQLSQADACKLVKKESIPFCDGTSDTMFVIRRV